MEVRALGLGVLEVIPRRHSDERGFLAETWQRMRFAAAGIEEDWVQDNHSYSIDKNILRGLHLQIGSSTQAKLVRVLRGSVLDVAVDLRRESGSFGKWVSCKLSSVSFNQIYIPPGFAHGFLTLEPSVEVLYKVSAPYQPETERVVAWNDPDLAIDWELSDGEFPLLSAKDSQAPRLAVLAARGDI